MAEHDEHSSFIKTPQQLITVVLLAFVVPIAGISLLVQLVVNRPHVDPSASTPEAVSARLAPVGKIEVAAAPGSGPAKSGEEIVKSVCTACHGSGVNGAPKIGDKGDWAPRLRAGLNGLLASAVKGITVKGALVMPPKGGATDLSDFEVARAIVYMANQSGGALKEPAEPKPAAKPEAKAEAKADAKK